MAIVSELRALFLDNAFLLLCCDKVDYFCIYTLIIWLLIGVTYE